jgi:hypothetical protein
MSAPRLRKKERRTSGDKRVCVRTRRCVVPSGLDLRQILPGTPVPGYRLSRPFGTDCVADLRFFFILKAKCS